MDILLIERHITMEFTTGKGEKLVVHGIKHATGIFWNTWLNEYCIGEEFFSGDIFFTSERCTDIAMKHYKSFKH